jgi:hypothetical protein
MAGLIVSEPTEWKLMTDLIYIGVVALFFVAGGLYARFCERL